MIQIDIPMPKNCGVCPICNEYLMCGVPCNGRGWGENDVSDYFTNGRPEWCPLKEQPKWIPVTERKPRSMANKVIVYLQHEDLVPYIGYGHYEKFKGEEMWYDLENDEQFIKRGYTVTHWMPMPKSPDGEILALC